MRAGLSWVKLSERTRELGRPIHRVALSKLEQGDRDIHVSELVGLAAALNVSPLALLFPDVLAEVEVLPGRPMSAVEGVSWFTGANDPWGASNAPIRLAQQIAQIDQHLATARHNAEAAERRPAGLAVPDALSDYMRQDAERAQETIRKLEKERERLIWLARDAQVQLSGPAAAETKAEEG